MLGEQLPLKTIAWGTCDDYIRWFHLMLPSYDWRYDICCDRCGFARRVLCWSNTHGWEVNYIFN